MKELGIHKTTDENGELVDTVFNYDIRISMNEMVMLSSMLDYFIRNNKTPLFARPDIIKDMREDFRRIEW